MKELSAMQNKVLRRIVKGKSNDEIAADLAMSPETVKSHLKKIYEKLGVANRVQAAVKAVRAGA